jgi:signal transduction histidine kinase
MATAQVRPADRAPAPAPTRPDWRGRLDLVVNRSIVYAALTGAIVLVYAGSVVLFRALLPGEIPYAVALMSTGAGALLALPLRDRLQRTVNRLMYGDRHEPYRALSRLGSQLETTAATNDVPAVVVETVAEALRLPFVEMRLWESGDLAVVATHGAVPSAVSDAELLRLPLLVGGESIGELVLSPRGPGESFNRADRRLLHDLARQSGPAIQASRLTADLRRSRERLVTTREEERRRLRRELHDGVGPTLAGTLMKVEAARTRLAGHPEEADRLLLDLASDTRRTIDEVRRLTYDLRPPALDELGLVGAIREQAARFEDASHGALSIDLEAALTGAGLPAAVEVAAYRIAVEGLTNVARHSGARTATVRLRCDSGSLIVDVEDDGTDLELPTVEGVGLRSMRERAEELGGSLSVMRGATGGLEVHATLPVRSATDA